MSPHLNGALLDLQEDMGRFARTHIAARNDLRIAGSFPHDLWGKLAAERLLGVGLPASYGGRGGGYLDILVAEEALVKHGHNMGFALSWLIQETISRFAILPFATEKIRELYLPQLAAGNAVGALAISEPGVGAHPKHLTTAASRREGSWSIAGRKTMITNGPIADLFVVVTVSGHDQGKKAFTAFLIPKTTPGLSLTEPIELGFLKPSQHGGIILNACILGDDHIVGNIGTAYRDIALPFRDIEDMLLAGVITGGFCCLLELGLEQLRSSAATAGEDIRVRLGMMGDYIDTLSIIAREAAAMTDASWVNNKLPSLLLTFKFLAANFLDMYRAFLDAAAIAPGPEGDALLVDLHKTIRIAGNVTKTRRMKRGDALLLRKE